jgi:hypothetical protein
MFAINACLVLALASLASCQHVTCSRPHYIAPHQQLMLSTSNQVFCLGRPEGPAARQQKNGLKYGGFPGAVSADNKIDPRPELYICLSDVPKVGYVQVGKIQKPLDYSLMGITT